MIFTALLLSVMAVTYDQCEIEGLQIDSIRAAGLYGDTLAIRKMACIASTGYLDESEDLFWRYRYLELEPCGVGYFERRLNPWRVAAQFLLVGLMDPRVTSCRENIERAIVRICKNDSSRTYIPCNPYRFEKPRAPLIARPRPPSDTLINIESDSESFSGNKKEPL